MGAVAQVVKTTPQGAIGQEQLGLVIPMRDGVRLAADLFLPTPNGRWPTVLIRTPYNRKTPANAGYRYFARRGYAVVIQDVRGRFASEGIFGSIAQEGPDGDDTISWISSQAWSDGSVVMAGSSYTGMTDWWAAIQNNPHLLSISTLTAGDDEYIDRYYSDGGALQAGHRLLWLAENLTPPSHVRPLFESYIGHLPLRTADLLATGQILPMWRVALSHPSRDAFWKSASIRERIGRVSVPVLSFGGWFDEYAPSDLDAFSRLAKRGHEVETWIGPWSHDPGWSFPTRSFGPEANIPFRVKQADWFERWTRKAAGSFGENNGPLLHIFVMGPNVWREEREWPLARTRFTPLYMRSGGHANTGSGDGALQWQPVRKGPSDSFVYDPRNPVPTKGGSICCEPTVLTPGPLDQTSIETRSDVLVYTSTPLTSEVEVTGPVRTVLYVATSANDTDFTAKLVDVQPGGKPLLVTDGIQRLRYRLSLDQAVFVKRNTPYQISVDCGVTSYVFAPGHRIRVEISSSNFPRFDRSMNSPRANADEMKLTKARQTIYHEKGYPSAIILPIVPRTGLRGAGGSHAHNLHIRSGLKGPHAT
ncbi:MAG: CocE/NonD family hydrolase [Bryobacteraceae bacterium]